MLDTKSGSMDTLLAILRFKMTHGMYQYDSEQKAMRIKTGYMPSKLVGLPKTMSNLSLANPYVH
jgi:hypothetical protein